MKKKIGIFTGYYPPHLGGVERYTEKLAKALEKIGYTVVIITSNHDELVNFEKLGNRKIYRLPTHKLAKNRYPLFKNNKEYRLLINRIKKENLDHYIVNTRFHLTSLIGARMGRKMGKPVMLIEHGTDHFTINHRFLDYFGKLYEHALTLLIKGSVNKFYGVSKKCNSWLKHFSISSSGVFYNAIEVEDKNKVKDYYKSRYPKNELIITYAGRLIKEKGILNLLEAFQEVAKKNKEKQLRLVIAGDGGLMEFIKLNYNDPSIELLGRLDYNHVMALYKRSDIFVYPSLYPEGLPTSILEAGLMECAIIATPRGGTEEVIIDNHHGIIVDGQVEGLRKALQQLVKSPSMRKELGTMVRRRIETTFNWDKVALEVDNEINKL